MKFLKSHKSLITYIKTTDFYNDNFLVSHFNKHLLMHSKFSSAIHVSCLGINSMMHFMIFLHKNSNHNKKFCKFIALQQKYNYLTR